MTGKPLVKDCADSFTGYLKEQHKTIKSTLKRIKVSFDSSDIHDFRVATKRFRSMDRFLISYHTGVPETKYKDNIRKVFRLLGYIRDLQVKQKWLKDFSKSHPPYAQAIKLIRKKLKKAEKAARKEFILEAPKISNKEFNRYLKHVNEAMLSCTSKKMYGNLQHFCTTLDENISAISDKKDNPEEWHEARKYLKTIYYLGEWLQMSPFKQFAENYDYKKIRILTTQLGDWHDLFLMEEYISDDQKFDKESLKEVKQQLKDRTALLKTSVNWNYNKF